MSMFASLQRDTLDVVKAEDLVAKEAQIHGWRSAVWLARREYITSMNLSLPSSRFEMSLFPHHTMNF